MITFCNIEKTDKEQTDNIFETANSTDKIQAGEYFKNSQHWSQTNTILSQTAWNVHVYHY